MPNVIRAVSVLTLLALVAVGSASPEGDTTKRQDRLAAFFSSTETRGFRGRERASIVVFGELPGILMGVYVFDPHGNCVALDDASDDLAVEWFPPRTQPYTYEVRNLGMFPTTLEVAIR